MSFFQIKKRKTIYLTEDLSGLVFTNIKLEHASIIDKRISSFAQALVVIFIFRSGAWLLDHPVYIFSFLDQFCFDTSFDRKRMLYIGRRPTVWMKMFIEWARQQVRWNPIIHTRHEYILKERKRSTNMRDIMMCQRPINDG